VHLRTSPLRAGVERGAGPAITRASDSAIVCRFQGLLACLRVDRNRVPLTVEPFEWYERAHSWPECTDSYIGGHAKLFETVVRKALAAAALNAEQIGAVITALRPKIAIPGIEARTLPRPGFRPDVRRAPTFG
jgi:predicted naringenin-chalcone synthase